MIKKLTKLSFVVCCLIAFAGQAQAIKNAVTFVANDANHVDSVVQPASEGESGGALNQSQDHGDVLNAALLGVKRNQVPVLIGGLGNDSIIGSPANGSVTIGGREVFAQGSDENDDGVQDGRTIGETVVTPSTNREDKISAGSNSKKSFIVNVWSPGDGSDTVIGSSKGIDVQIFANTNIINDGEETFGVVNDKDGPARDTVINEDTGLPTVSIADTPGRCNVIQDGLEELGLENPALFQFVLRGVEAGNNPDDNGLRVTLTTSNMDFIVCPDAEGVLEVLDLRTNPPTAVTLDDIPGKAGKITREIVVQ